ncbi:hypothetical protein [Pseudactinotalea sp.]|uniref:primase 1D-like protein n=1 Tax=Pseudactinotalea sp. TaxID=1926260 RepID=UPI003B3B469E
MPALLLEARVETIELNVLRRRPSFQGGEVSPLAQSLTDPARDEHQARGFGFWEFLLAKAVTTDSGTRGDLLRAALRHNSDGATRIALGREEFVELLGAGEYANLSPRELVSFCSSVVVADTKQPMHLPLLDLGVKPGSDGEASAIDAIHALGLRGLLYMSGRSYHFYGAEPVALPDLVAILGRSQLLSPIVDSRWVSHQLMDGRCGLRISTDSEKAPVAPVFVTKVGTIV